VCDGAHVPDVHAASSGLLPRADYGVQAAIKKHYKKRKWPKPEVMEDRKPWRPTGRLLLVSVQSLDVKTM